jgi:hypothetical protein
MQSITFPYLEKADDAYVFRVEVVWGEEKQGPARGP